MKSFKSMLLLIPLLLITGICAQVQAQTPNPGDSVAVSGKVVAFGDDNAVPYIDLEVGDFQSGNTQVQRFFLSPGYPVVDASGNNVTLVAGMMVKIEGTMGNNSIPIFTRVVIDAGQPGEPEPPAGEGFGGIVRSNNGSVLQLEGFDEVAQATFSFNVSLATGGKVFDQSGNEISLLLIPVGNIAHGFGEKQANGDFLAYEIHDGGLPPDNGGGGWNPGDSFQFGGQVEFLGNGFIILMSGDPTTGETHHDTVYFDSGIVLDPAGNPASLKIGDFVDGTVLVQSDKRLQYTSLTVYPPGPGPGEHFTKYGVVTSFGEGFVEVSWEENGETKTERFEIPAGMQIEDEEGNPAELTVGVHIGVEVEIVTADSFNIIRVFIFDEGPGGNPGEQFPFGGQVVDFGSGFVKFEHTNPDDGTVKTDSVAINSSTVIVDDSGNPAELVIGAFIEGTVEIQVDKSPLAISITVHGGGEPIQFGGLVVAVGSGFVKFEHTDPDDGTVKTDSVAINSSTVIVDDSGNPAELAIGAFIEGTIEIQQDGSPLAISITVHGGGEPIQFGGLVVAVGADYLDIAFTNEEDEIDTARIKISAETTLSDQNGISISLADFAVGDMVHGEVKIQGPDDATAVFVIKGEGPDGREVFVGGNVLEVGADYLLVFFTDPETGDTGTVRVLIDNETELLDADSLAIPLSAFSAGDQVFARGEATTDSEMLADRIRLLPGKPEAEINFSGTIIRAYGDQLFLSGQSPTGVTYFLRLLVGAQTTDDAGNPVSASSFSVGNQVHGQGSITPDFAVNAEVLDNGDGDNIQLGQKVPFSGIIIEVGNGYFTSEYGHPALTKRNDIDSGTFIHGTSGSSLAVGDFFSAVSEIGSDGSLKVLEVQTFDGSQDIPGVNIQLQGQISQVGADFLVVQDQAEGELKVLILANTFDEAGNPVAAGDFRSGDSFRAGGVIQACELVVLTRVAAAVADTIDFHGEVIALGEDYFDVSVSSDEGGSTTLRGYVGSSTLITDRENNPVDLNIGDEISGRGIPRDQGSFNALFVLVESTTEPMPLPGDAVDFEGSITEISGTRVNIKFDSPDSPVPSAWVDIPTGVTITTSGGQTLEIGWLAAGDELYVEGIVNQDGVSVTAGKVQYLSGGLRLLSGRVVSVGASQFEMEARDTAGRSIIAQVAVVSTTRIVHRDTGAILTIARIIKGSIVTAVARLNSGTSFNAILVTVPPLERLRLEGRVLALITNGFSLEVQDNQNTYNTAVTTSTATVWLLESNGGYQAAAAGDMKTGDLVQVSGARTGALSARADTVIIRDTGDLEVRTYTIRNGKLAGTVLSLQLDMNEGTGSAEQLAAVLLTVAPDYANLTGTIDFGATAGGIEAVKLVKVSGTPGALTGRWSGYSQSADGNKVLISSEMFQSGTAVTGSVTTGGQSGTGDDGIPETGDEVTFTGQVTSVAAPTLVVTYYDQLKQRIDKAVIVHSRTEYVGSDGKVLIIELDSLLSREVEVTGILQDNLSVVASRIEVYPVSGDENVSRSMPQFTNLTWTSSSRALRFSVDGSRLDNISSGDVSFSGNLSSDRLSLTLKAVVSGDSLTLAARRIGGDDESLGGEWTGSVTQVVSGRIKLWPVFLSFFESNGSFGGNYEIGEGRFKAEVTVRNNAPVFQPVAEVKARELQSVTIQLSATDPDGDPITLSVSGTPVIGATFTDNGNGTGSYSLTVPQLSAGKNELFVNFAADDGKGGLSSIVVEIEVEKSNRPPELGSFPDTLRLAAGQKYQISIPVSDSEGGELEFEYTSLPVWARTSASQVTFEPPFGSAGTYSFSVKVEDDQDGEDSQTYQLKVTEANRAPRFIQIEPITVQAGENVSFTVRASDPDAGDAITYSAAVVAGVSALPAGASFDPVSGAFIWTPSQAQVGPFKAGFVVSDSKSARAGMTVNIFVGQVAAPPTIVVPDTVVANQGESASFTATGQSSTGGEVEFLARNLPPGSNWSTDGDSLEWYPSFQQQGEFVVTMSASDGSFRTDRDVVIMVNPAPQIPVLQPLQDFTVQENQVLRFQVVAKYPDGSPAVFDPPAGLPAGSGFDVLTGSFRFLPDYNQAGSYPLTFSVTAPGGMVYSVSNTVTVTDKNRRPKIADLANVSVDAGEAVSFTVSAVDPDGNVALTYAAENLPQGATFNTGANPPAFNWTPALEGTYEISFTATDPGQLSDRATLVITVGEQNLPPVLGQLADLRVAEGDTLTLVVSASDPEGEPVSVFVSPLPTNANYDNQSNTFVFKPSFSQSGSYNLRFVASDGELTDESRITITVADVPLPPQISVPVDWSVEEGDVLQFTVVVRDASGNRRPVFSSNLPAGALLNSETGDFHWLPLYDQAGEYQLTFNASDGKLSAQANVKIVVADKNQPPTLFRVDHQEVLEGELIGFEISAFDPDGDEVTIGIDSSGTPYINSAEIRNSNVFVFNTALLDATQQIPSAVFKVTANDGRGGADTMRVDFRIIRRDDVNVPDIPPGGNPFNYDFPGTGLRFRMGNNGSGPIGGQITGFEVSGELTPGGSEGGTLLAGASTPDLSSRYPQLAGSKDKVTVRSFLSDDGSLGGDFYSVRRGWGLDLSSDLLGGLTSLQFDLTLSYQDRDIPATDIPEFQESAISIFGLNASGNFVQIATQLDTAANTATAPVDLALYTDFTLGVILDLAAPVISYTSKLVSTTNEAGPYNVITTIVDNVIINNARLFYSTDGETYSSVALQRDSLLINGYTGDIPGQVEGTTIYYYIQASDEEYTVTDPANAPQAAYQFSILLDGVAGAGAGDANGDGKVNIFDLLEVLSILGGRKPATPGADADGNGRVDIFDLLEVLKLM